MVSVTRSVFASLDAVERKILQALAVFGRPTTPRAVSYTLRPYVPELSIDLAAMRLEQLVADFPALVHRESGHYFLHPEDCQNILETLDPGDDLDRFEAGEPLYTRFALLARAADYYMQRRKPQRAWQSIEDLAAQLNEFDLRCLGHDYESAAIILGEISFNYLLRWGYHRLVVELRERLMDKLEDPKLAQANLGELGSAYAYLGDTERAIACQEKALQIARFSGDRYHEGVWLSNLGNRYVNLGQTYKALGYYEQALELARERTDRRAEALNVASLGTCYAHLGQMAQAIDHYEAGLAIAQELNELSMEGFCLHNLGNVYAALGNVTRAIALHDQALEIARQMGSRVEESRRLGGLADALIMGECYTEAIENLRLGLAIDEETGAARGKNHKRVSLARAYLFTDDLQSARTAIEAAQQQNAPENAHNVLALLGVIALRQGEREIAHSAFSEAIDHSGSLLLHNTQNYDALTAQGLAFCGLALSDTAAAAATREAYLSAAARAYRNALQSNAGAGLAAQSLRLFDMLALADHMGILARVRAAVMGE